MKQTHPVHVLMRRQRSIAVHRGQSPQLLDGRYREEQTGLLNSWPLSWKVARQRGMAPQTLQS